jgi:hypothetical protein
MSVNNIIRLKESEDISVMFSTLQNTKYRSMDKTEIIKSLLAQAVYEIELEHKDRGVSVKLNRHVQLKKNLRDFRKKSLEKGRLWLIENGYNPDKLTDQEMYKIIEEM